MLGDPLAAHSGPLKPAIDGPRTLTIEGTDAAETIIAEVSGNPAFITIDQHETGATGPPMPVSYPLDSFDRLVINARGGADFVNIIDAGELLEAQNKILTLDGGTGDNVVVLTHLPFKPETATQVMQLLDLSKRIEGVAKRASEATTQALTVDATKLIESIRVNIADVSGAMAKDAQSQLFDPARELLEVEGPKLNTLGESIIARGDGLAGQQAFFIAELAKRYVPPNGVFPPEDEEDRDPDPGLRDAECPDTDVPKEAEMDAVEARADELAQTGENLGGEAKTQIEKMGKQIEIDAAILEQRAAEFENRAEQLSAKAEALAEQGETDMTAAADRVLAAVGELQSMEQNFQDAGMALRGEIELAIALARQRQAPAPPGAPDCDTPIMTVHTYVGSGFFFTLSGGSWSITGGSGTDFLFGGLDPDDIHGGGGNDVIFGLGGNDHIHGDDGNDYLLVGEFLIDLPFLTGDDCIWGDKGTDLIIGDNVLSSTPGTPGGDDSLWGNDDLDIVIGDDVLPDIFSQTLLGGADKMEGNDGIDFLVGCGGADSIKGNDDIDFAEGNGGGDTIDGGDGRDFSLCFTTVEIGNLLHGGKDADEITGGSGIDVILGDEDRDTLTGKGQIDLMFGGGERDTMNGDAGGVICVINGVPIRLGNFMVGGPENDTMRAGGDLDVMLGRDGDDKIYGYDGSTQALTALDADVLIGGSGVDIMEGDDESPGLRLSIDVMVGGPGGDEMRGGKDIDLMFGGSGNDHMSGDSNAVQLLLSIDLMVGGPDNDQMDGGNSLDFMVGGDGNDTMLGDDERLGVISPDLMFGGSGVDTMNGGSLLDIMVGGDDFDHMLGDSNDPLQLLSVDIMFGNSGPDYMDGGNSIDFMFGGPDCDTMLGDNSSPGRISPDFMFGQGEDDNMDGGNSPDFMWGGPGNDRMVGDQQLQQPLSLDFMFGEDGADTMLGGQGFDLISGGPGVDYIEGQLGPDLLFGGADSDTIKGGDLLDFIWGNGGNDVIEGGDWPDFIRGGPDDDCLFGGHGQDLISGGTGNDCIHGDGHLDWIRGNGGDDLIFGDNGVDFLMGGPGSDRLDGGASYDFIFGGPGQDEGWRGPKGVFFSISTKHDGSSGLNCSCQIEQQKGKICVHKFNDLDGDGFQDSGEPPLPGWIFEVTPGCAGVTLITDANGNACADFFAGMYTVTEQLQNGWMATTPTVQVVRVTGGRTTDVVFGNKQAGCDLLISKSISPNPAQTGQQVNVSLTVTNVATVMCQSAPTVVKDTKPPGLTFSLPVTVTQTGGNATWTCSLGNPSGDLSCTTQNLLPPGYSAAFTFTATVTALPPGGVINNCATVTNGSDVNLPNNQSCVTLAMACGGAIFGENFDAVSAPALPAGWVAQNATGNPPMWVTSTTTPNTAPNAAFIDDPATISDKSLDTPAITINSASAQVSFRNNFDLQSGFDGGVLEASIGGGAFNDIVDLGGVFVAGGYTAEIDGATGNPLAGRPSWTGSSCGYICTVVNLPAFVNGQSIRFRFRMGSDQSIAGSGWRIDDFKILPSGAACGPCVPATSSPAQVLSISTQGRVGTGINVLIGGFTITGNVGKTVVIRGLGPSLVSSGISDFLADPTLELRDSSGNIFFANNDWQDDPHQSAKLLAVGLAPTNSRESAIILTFPPCASYTATLAGANGGTGIGAVEIYDVNQAADSQLANLNTRGLVQTGGDNMIARFVLGGSSNTRVALRGIGPSLNPLNPFLADPALELDRPGLALITNDNWLSNSTFATALILQGLALPNPSESGIFVSLPPGAYSATLSGKSGAGLSLVEIYNVH